MVKQLYYLKSRGIYRSEHMSSPIISPITEQLSVHSVCVGYIQPVDNTVYSLYTVVYLASYGAKLHDQHWLHGMTVTWTWN
jgi:hypothetical protein